MIHKHHPPLPLQLPLCFPSPRAVFPTGASVCLSIAIYTPLKAVASLAFFRPAVPGLASPLVSLAALWVGSGLNLLAIPSSFRWPPFVVPEEKWNLSEECCCQCPRIAHNGDTDNDAV